MFVGHVGTERVFSATRREMEERHRNRLTLRWAWFWTWMPYSFRKLERGRHLWLPLNRDYKPLGLPRERYVDYEDFASQALAFDRDPRLFKNVWTGTDLGRGADQLWLYDDRPESRVDYWQRLDRLLRHPHVLGVRSFEEHTGIAWPDDEEPADG